MGRFLKQEDPILSIDLNSIFKIEATTFNSDSDTYSFRAIGDDIEHRSLNYKKLIDANKVIAKFRKIFKQSKGYYPEGPDQCKFNS